MQELWKKEEIHSEGKILFLMLAFWKLMLLSIYKVGSKRIIILTCTKPCYVIGAVVLCHNPIGKPLLLPTLKKNE